MHLQMHVFRGLSLPGFYFSLLYLRSCALSKALCTCKCMPFHSAEIRGKKEQSTCSVIGCCCEESTCRRMFLHVDRGVINKHSALKRENTIRSVRFLPAWSQGNHLLYSHSIAPQGHVITGDSPKGTFMTLVHTGDT